MPYSDLKSRIITSVEALEEGACFLSETSPEFARILPQIIPLPLRRRPSGFAALLSMIMSQQVSVASAEAIWKRLKTAKLTGPRKIIRASEADLKACGLSRQKIIYAKELAISGINYNNLAAMSDRQVIETLVKVKGIGTWTAEIYTMFSLGRADIFASGDLALQEATRHLFKLENRPSETEMRRLAAIWSPWQAVAARALWAYYRQIKQREGIG